MVDTKQYMPSDWRNAVLKVKINDADVRRIPIDRIMKNQGTDIASNKEEASLVMNLSIDKLVQSVKQYSGIMASRNQIFSIRLTYLDEEDEEIVVSTDLELCEAVAALQKYSSNIGQVKNLQSISSNHLSTHILRMSASVKLKQKSKVLRSSVFAPFPPMFDKVDRIQSHRDPSTKLPAGIVVIDTIFSVVANILGNFQEPQNGKTMNDGANGRNIKVFPPQSATSGKDHTSFDNNFVHKRHTCDVCRVSPIVGYRYHSTVKVNYDICHDCFCKKCDRNDADEDLSSYRLVQNKPDRFFKRPKNTRTLFSTKNVNDPIWCPTTGKRRREIPIEELTDVIVNQNIIQKCLDDIREKKRLQGPCVNSSDAQREPNSPTESGKEEISDDADASEKKSDASFSVCEEQKDKGMIEQLDSLIYLAEKEIEHINNLTSDSSDEGKTTDTDKDHEGDKSGSDAETELLKDIEVIDISETSIKDSLTCHETNKDDNLEKKDDSTISFMDFDDENAFVTKNELSSSIISSDADHSNKGNVPCYVEEQKLEPIKKLTSVSIHKEEHNNNDLNVSIRSISSEPDLLEDNIIEFRMEDSKRSPILFCDTSKVNNLEKKDAISVSSFQYDDSNVSFNESDLSSSSTCQDIEHAGENKHANVASGEVVSLSSVDDDWDMMNESVDEFDMSM